MKVYPFLVPPSPAKWRGTLGVRLDKSSFGDYVKAIKPEDMKFAPNKIILHNTAAPDQKQWLASPIYPNRMKGLTGWYRDLQIDSKTKKKLKEPWMAGPHLFCDDNGMWLFTPLWEQGTHSPSFNSSSWGIEMVGDYDKEPFDTGFGAKVRDNAVYAMAVLLKHLGKAAGPAVIRLHKEDPKTTHACPGKNVHKDDILARVATVMGTL